MISVRNIQWGIYHPLASNIGSHDDVCPKELNWLFPVACYVGYRLRVSDWHSSEYPVSLLRGSLFLNMENWNIVLLMFDSNRCAVFDLPNNGNGCSWFLQF